jgi:putative aldouronate transport system permease protein
MSIKIKILKKKHISTGSRLFDVVNSILLLIFAFIIIYPLWYIVCVSLTSGSVPVSGRFIFWPEKTTLFSYKLLLNNPDIGSGYKNTLFYTFVGTAINLFCTIMCAYPLSRPNMPFKGFFMRMIVFTMFFSGGLVPTYLTVNKLGLINTRWALLLPSAITTFNMIIMRTFFLSSIPQELHESAYLDGAGELRILLSIVLPLSLPIIATMVLFYAVGHWNSYFSAMIYLHSKKYYPLQLYLRNYLIENAVGDYSTGTGGGMEFEGTDLTIKYSIIIITILPIIVLYPFLQRYFVKGVMVGSIKG